MSGSTAIRGTRIGSGSGPVGESERGEMAPRRHVTFYCTNGHVTKTSFAEEAPDPETWECPRCGMPAGTDPSTPPPNQRAEPYKTHLAYVRERRSDEDGNALLEEALAKLRARRGE